MGTGDTIAEYIEWWICLRHFEDLLAEAPCVIHNDRPNSQARWLIMGDDLADLN